MADFYVPLVSIGVAVFVSAVNYVIQRWRYRIDRLSAAVDAFCAETNLTTDFASSYWMLDLKQNEQAKEGVKLEYQLVGLQLRLGALFDALLQQDPSLKLDDIEPLIDQFFDAITGGDFRVGGRAPNNWQLQQSHALAAALNGQLRIALNARVKKWS